MKFKDLSEQDKILNVKDNFQRLLEFLSKDPSKLTTYIPIPTKPKGFAAMLESISDDMKESDKTAIMKRNEIAKAKAQEETSKAEAEYNKATERFEKAKSIISKLEKMEGCVCGTCLNINISAGSVPPELEVLIDAARKEAEEKTY
jgi:hypothetical protein